MSKYSTTIRIDTRTREEASRIIAVLAEAETAEVLDFEFNISFEIEGEPNTTVLNL